MKDYKNIDEVIDYIQSLLQKENEDITDIDEYHKVFKFSAEKLAKKFNLDETKLINDFNQYKKQIYKKIIIFDKVNVSKIEYIDAIVSYCEESELDIDSIISLISPALKNFKSP